VDARQLDLDRLGVIAGLLWNTRARELRTCSHSSSTIPLFAEIQIVLRLGSSPASVSGISTWYASTGTPRIIR
jgi:hypothetical protein